MGSSYALPRIFIFILATVIIQCTSKPEEHFTWSVYKGDAASSSYSALNQINRGNVSELRLAWTFQPMDTPPGVRLPKFECNPIIVDDIMYSTSARHWVYALHSGTGEKLWEFDPFNGEKGGGVKRGVSYWARGDDKRILFTAGEHLFALDAQTGQPIEEFGNNGRVALDQDLGVDPDSVWVIPTSPGVVFKDLIIQGSEVSELYDAAPGHLRAYHIPTGRLEWTFNTIPQPGETGYETWPKDAWKYAGGANNWAGMSLDPKRGIVYVPLGSPSYDYYGANRKGKNLFGNSVVALDALTGQLIWYFQTVHHDLWDYDLPAPPNLVTIRLNGKQHDAVVQTTKTGFLFVLDRDTGEPLFPVEERPVPASNLPGEETWPTQPIPVKPKPYTRQHITEKDLTAFSKEDSLFIVQRFSKVRYEGLFTPPDRRGTLMLPGSRGGSEWGGAAFDPETGFLFVNSNESSEFAYMQPVQMDEINVIDGGKSIYSRYCSSCHGLDRKGYEPDLPSLMAIKNRLSEDEVLDIIMKGSGKMPAFGPVVEGKTEKIISFLFEREEDRSLNSNKIKKDTAGYFNSTAYARFRDAAGRPATKPPWGTLNAIDLNTGEYAWRIPLGNRPELQGEGEPMTGTENFGGPMVTAGGLVFIGATSDKKFRAFDKQTGDLLWETELPGGGYASPATYMSEGRQFITLAVSSGDRYPAGLIMAFALPE